MPRSAMQQKLHKVMEYATERGSLSWHYGTAGSLRRYYYQTALQQSFCVSTRSAELTYVVEGELAIDFGPQRQQIVLRPQQACLVMQATPHQVSCTPATRFVVVDVADPRLVGLGVNVVARLPVALHKILTQLASDVSVSRPSSGPGIEQIVAALTQSNSIVMQEAHSTRRMKQIKAHLEKSYAEAVCIKNIAKQCNMEASYLVRAFKQNFAVSPYAYVQALRQEHFFWELARRGADSTTLLQCASASGFSDYSTFCRRFKTAFGAPPSQWLKNAS